MTCHRNIRWTWIESVWFINLNLASFQALFLNFTVHKKATRWLYIMFYLPAQTLSFSSLI
jgi:hypothetical protein